MRAPPEFTIIVPAYNAALTLEAAVRSALAQTVADLEVIVVDDGSEDETGAIARGLAAVDPRVLLIAQENRGVSAARNAAIKAASGRYLAFLDSDDLLLPRYLEEMSGVLRSAPGAGLAACGAWHFDEASGRWWRADAAAPWPAERTHEQLLEALLRRNFIFVGATIPASVLRRVGGFRTDLPACEDYEMWLRILVAGYTPVRTPSRLAVWRDRAGSMSSDLGLMYRTAARVCDEIAESSQVSAEARAVAREQAEAHERNADAETGSGPPSAARRLRHELGRVRRERLSRRRFYRDTPEEIVETGVDRLMGMGS